MDLIILKNKEEAVKKAAKLISKEMNKKPFLVLGLASGKTMIPLYNELVNLYRKRKINFSKAKTFNLDEYQNVEEKYSLRSFMDKHLFSKINLKKENICFLPTKADKKACKNYETKIKSARGIDLQILGIGRNAHIAFNEPESSFKSQTRIVKLASSTRKANSNFFPSIKYVPTKAATMGLSTILKSKKIILLATGKNKAKAISVALKQKPNKKSPAGILQRHKQTIFILDKEAAANTKI